MKKVSEYFDLPVGSDTGMIIDSEGRQCGEFNLMVEAKAAAHAINNCDALADELEKLLAHIAQRNGRVTEAQFQESLATLNTYRGAK